MELELSYSVGDTAGLGLLVSLLRESFHGVLQDSLRMAEKVATARRMLQRLDSSNKPKGVFNISACIGIIAGA